MWTARLHRPILAAAETLTQSVGVMEGDGIDPRIAGELADRGVATVYVIEDDPRRLRKTFTTRPSASRFLALPRPEQDVVVEMNLAYGACLHSAAVSAHQPWVDAKPWPTLPDRIVDAVRGATRKP